MGVKRDYAVVDRRVILGAVVLLAGLALAIPMPFPAAEQCQERPPVPTSNPLALNEESSAGINGELASSVLIVGPEGLSGLLSSTIGYLKDQFMGDHPVLVDSFKGKTSSPFGSIIYSLSNIALDSFDVNVLTSAMDEVDQVFTLIAEGISFSLDLDYAWHQDNWLQIPYGSGTASITATGGVLQTDLGIDADGTIEVKDTRSEFSDLDIQFDGGITGAIYKWISSFLKDEIKEYMNDYLQTTFSNFTATGVQFVTSSLPRHIKTSNAANALNVSVDYFPVLLKDESIVLQLSFETLPSNSVPGDGSVTSCDCPMSKQVLPVSTKYLDGDNDKGITILMGQHMINCPLYVMYANDDLSLEIPTDSVYVTHLFPGISPLLRLRASSAPSLKFLENRGFELEALAVLDVMQNETRRVLASLELHVQAGGETQLLATKLDQTTHHYTYPKLAGEIGVLKAEVTKIIGYDHDYFHEQPSWLTAEFFNRFFSTVTPSLQHEVNVQLMNGVSFPLPDFLGLKGTEIKFLEGIVQIDSEVFHIPKNMAPIHPVVPKPQPVLVSPF